MLLHVSPPLLLLLDDMMAVSRGGSNTAGRLWPHEVGNKWAPRSQAGDAGISQASPSALTSQHGGSGQEGEKQCCPKSLTAPKLMHGLQRATHVAHVSFLKCSKRSKTAAGLVFTPRLDASVNVSAASSYTRGSS